MAGPSSAFSQVIAPFAEQVDKEWLVVRTDFYTYAETIDYAWLLYDNRADPDQLGNLVDQVEHTSLQTGLKRELDQWLEKSGDTFEPRTWYLDRYGYEVEGEGGAAPYTHPIT